MKIQSTMSPSSSSWLANLTERSYRYIMIFICRFWHGNFYSSGVTKCNQCTSYIFWLTIYCIFVHSYDFIQMWHLLREPKCLCNIWQRGGREGESIIFNYWPWWEMLTSLLTVNPAQNHQRVNSAACLTTPETMRWDYSLFISSEIFSGYLLMTWNET